MIIHLFAPFFTGSHKAWAEGYAQNSKHTVKIFSLPGKYWKWRMHGAAVNLAQQFLDQNEQPDLILVTDMLDVATFLALSRDRTATIPLALYFHENQLTYPWSPTDEDVALKRDRHYAWINYTSALTADRIYFNSKYHKGSFLNALPAFLRAFPDYKGLGNVDKITQKSLVLPLGMNLKKIDEYKIEPRQNEVPILLWNHRWEYDKNPEPFFQLCFKLKEENIDFQLVVLGEYYANAPAIFKAAKTKLSEHILHWGFAENFKEYAKWLWRATILPVTSKQDFFGGSVVEAMYCNTYPILPNRLAFPEHIPARFQNEHLYNNEEELFEKVKALLNEPSLLRDFTCSEWVESYDWEKMGLVYDEVFFKTPPSSFHKTP